MGADAILAALLDLLIKGADYFLVTLPEQDRQKVVEQWKAQRDALATDRQGLVDELERVKAEHAALQAQLDALKAQGGG